MSSRTFKIPIRPLGYQFYSKQTKAFRLQLTTSLLFVLFLFNTPTSEGQESPEVVNIATASKATEYRANEALESLREWTSRFGRDVHYGTQEATCHRSIRDQYEPGRYERTRRGDYKANMVSIDWTRQHREIVETIGTTMGWHREAVEHIAREAEYLAGNHTFEKALRFDYIDVHRLANADELAPSRPSEEEPFEPQPDERNQTDAGTGEPNTQDEPAQEVGQLDSNGQLVLGTDSVPSEEQGEPLPKPAKLTAANLEAATSDGEWQTPFRYLKLSKHRNFDEVFINTDESAVHVPVHIFPGESNVMNGIAWSEGLTRVFKENMVRNPKLTNQYFASQSGFLRLFPAQRWQIARSDPDLYDGRMRPWYAAGASSRKDVVILVDSSGSMTGSRRDIAKGVVFEILDTLTDNDHFMVLKFSDSVQQVAVPNCDRMRAKRKPSPVPAKNTLFSLPATDTTFDRMQGGRKSNESLDIGAFYMLPATGKNVRHIKSNFTIPTSGIANFSRALVTAFEVLNNYQNTEQFDSACNQAIMLITDGSPSSFEEIFNRYNYPNAPVRVFTYLIGREAGDVGHTKMMACHNRGYYTHVINLAEVRETVQQYIPVMARPLVLNGSHPINWTPAYGELTYQMLTDWIWESKRRDKARAILASQGRGSPSNAEFLSNVRITDEDAGGSVSAAAGSQEDSFDPGLEANIDEELERIDHFGYQANPECFWQTHQNDLLTTVVQPVYDHRNESLVTEKFLVKNTWTVKETLMRTAQILGVAAADMKINDIVGLAASHKLGPNGYAIMLTNNGYAMHHPDLRSVLEPFSSDPSERNMRILKPFFSSLDFTQVEHILEPAADRNFTSLRHEAVSGLTGWRELLTKRTLDCQKRVQSRRQSFYYKSLKEFPFPFIIAIPESYGRHKLEAQIEIKVASLPEKLTTYFTTSDFDLWTIHPKYSYCEGPSNNTIATLLDAFQRVEAGKLDSIQWRAAESKKPPLQVHSKIVCDKELLQSLVYDAVATFGFSDNCGPPNPNAESNLLSMFGVRFAFVTTRNGLTRVRHFDVDDITIKKEALAFARKHSRGVDETFYQRTVDYNMLINETATLLQVPFNTFERIRLFLEEYERDQALKPSQIDPSVESYLAEQQSATARLFLKDMNLMEKLELLRNSSISMIATQSILVNEGKQGAVAGVTGVFYDYASFVIRFFNSTSGRFADAESPNNSKKPAVCYSENPSDEICDDSKMVKCGFSNDTVDCLLVDNNGYILVSENLDFVGRHLKAYEPMILERLLRDGVFHEVNITDYQAVCIRSDEKQQQQQVGLTSRASRGLDRFASSLLGLDRIIGNSLYAISHAWTILAAATSALGGALALPATISQQQQSTLSMLSLLPNKTYLRACEKTLTLYETRSTGGRHIRSDSVAYYTSKCHCQAWFVYEQVPKTNLLMLIVDSQEANCNGRNCNNSPINVVVDQQPDLQTNSKLAGNSEQQVCSGFERDSELYKKRIDSCFSTHPDEEHIKICGAASRSIRIDYSLMIILICLSSWRLFRLSNQFFYLK